MTSEDRQKIERAIEAMREALRHQPWCGKAIFDICTCGREAQQRPRGRMRA